MNFHYMKEMSQYIHRKNCNICFSYVFKTYENHMFFICLGQTYDKHMFTIIKNYVYICFETYENICKHLMTYVNICL